MSDKLPHIRGRIAALRSFHEIVRALQSLAAAQSRAAAPALEAARAHLAATRQALAAFAPGLLADLAPGAAEDAPQAPAFGPQSARADAPETGPAAAPRATLLVMGSEHGFVGAMNARLAARAVRALAPGEALEVVGARLARTLAQESGRAPDAVLPMPARIASAPELAARLAARLARAPSLRLIHAPCGRGGPQAPVLTRQAPHRLDPAAARPPSGLDAPLAQLAPDALAAGLADELLFSRIAAALVETMAAENAARLEVMRAADRNIREKLAELTRQSLILRQDEITEEMMDVLTGAEALRQAEEDPL
ncbi:F0F1 ATP synthase subunit gamma [Oceanicella actignis]|uniref:F0F1 ATP synthase subunit gamma n=1 Tax=Oceanicella actignis TaxID=1189325 RepID=UPI0011E7ADF2|nr:F0F1 ATP synthase subunit gamma [Oceanicella actignis]TYO91602.1 F-type H+-transporting ATPase subunit gamma [Oceanicella actignis]